jgi:predicted amidohydrolase
MKILRVAVAQYDIGFFNHFDDFAHKLNTWFDTAHKQGAQLLVFPEYASMELTSLLGKAIYTDLKQQLLSMQSLYAAYQACYVELAKRYNVMVVAGSFPVQLPSERFRNRANVFSPDGLIGFQDKLIMTRFEDEKWAIQAAKDLKVINTDIGKLGINICYDSEFPMFANRQIEAGAELIVVPSCTYTEAGFHRVRIGCQARALENQCYVLQAPTVGEALWSPAVDINIGRASVYTPLDKGFPANGVLAQAADTEPQWVLADLHMALISDIREQGAVLNKRDWTKQFDIDLSET